MKSSFEIAKTASTKGLIINLLIDATKGKSTDVTLVIQSTSIKVCSSVDRYD